MSKSPSSRTTGRSPGTKAVPVTADHKSARAPVRDVGMERLTTARATAARVVQLHGPDPYLVHFERLDAEIRGRETRAAVMDRVAEIAGAGD